MRLRRASADDDRWDDFEVKRRRKVVAEMVPPRLARYATPEHLRSDVREWCDAILDDETEKFGLLLLGNVGAGKTTTAYAAVQRLFDLTFQVPKVETAGDLCAKLRPGGSDASPEQTLAHIRRAPILMIDELGEAKNSEWISQEMYRVIDHRVNHNMPTIYTANSYDEIHQTWGDRLFSRITGGSRIVGFEGPDLRMTGA